MKWTDHRHNENGEEVLDPVPLQPPLGYKRAPTLAEQIRHQVLAAKLDALNDMEETDEEADDFVVGDDFEPLSPHENDHIPTIKALKARAAEINAEIQRVNLEAYKKRVEKELDEKRAPQAPTKPTPSTTPETELT